MSCGVNRSSLIKWLILQNCLKINGTILFSSKSYPLISAGLQKPKKLTASKILFAEKITLIPKIKKKMTLTFWKLKSKLVMTYLMFVLLRPRWNDREQFQREEWRFIDFQEILKKKSLEKEWLVDPTRRLLPTYLLPK